MNMDTLKVSIDVEEGTISVYNNGKGIPLEIHSQNEIYISELMFGHLPTESNDGDAEKEIHTGKSTSQKYKQTWTDNMSKRGKAEITENADGEEFTRVTFRPDLARFVSYSNIMDKEEFQIFEKVMDLQYDKEYSDVSELRYGRLMIITDQDDDGLIPDSLVGFMPGDNRGAAP
ncbi:histidine kinase-like ATPase [Lentinula raphanica]|nr:histidine kinase-like ATPase [Lentinula raphanica]